ncbi:MAG: hypothetical protein ACR2NU_06975, partial [Aeoliella sp.]
VGRAAEAGALDATRPCHHQEWFSWDDIVRRYSDVEGSTTGDGPRTSDRVSCPPWAWNVGIGMLNATT